MPLRRFPYGFNVGTDICNIERVFRLLCRGHANYIDHSKLHRFMTRCFTDLEINVFRKTGPPMDQDWNVACHLAGRWAAKEAIIKASNRRLFMKDIVIYRDAANKQAPFGIILDQTSENTSATDGETASHGRSREESNSIDSVSQAVLPQQLLELGLDGQVVPISISHDKDYAVAIAIVPTT